MNSYCVEIKDLAVLGIKNEDRNGEGAYSTITRYRCTCGSGEIEKYDAKRSGERFVVLKCAECRKRLRPFVTVDGGYFRFTLI